MRNRYEAAFERFLRTLGLPYLANRQERRFETRTGASIKSFDFVVTVPGGDSWIVELKGRLFPGGKRSRRYWKNWTTRDDLSGLLHWEDLFNGVAPGLENVPSPNFGGGFRFGVSPPSAASDSFSGRVPASGFVPAPRRSRSLLAFAFRVVGERRPIPLDSPDADSIFIDRGVEYAFFVVPMKRYLGEARFISERWQTFEIPARRFRQVAIPAARFFLEGGRDY